VRRVSELKPGRLVAVDLLRGYFIFAVIVDHLARFPGLYDMLTGRGWLWVSAAEGFFLLSGAMVGLVRGRQLAVEPFRKILVRIWQRAGKLYVWTVLLTLLFTLWAVAVGGHGVKPGFCDTSNALEVLWRTLTLNYVYGWTDFLAYYVLFLLVAPFALWLVARRRWWWLVPLMALAAWRLFGRNDLAFSWQLPFFLGLTFGYYLRQIEAFFMGLGRAWQRALVWAMVSSAAVTAALSFALSYSQNYGRNLLSWVPVAGGWFGKLLSFYLDHLAGKFSRAPIGSGRLLMFVLWFAAAYYLVRRYEDVLVRWVGWFFLPLGAYSLHAFILQGLAVFATSTLIGKTDNLWLNFILASSVMGIIWLFTKRKWLFWLIPT
jgi:peptidoglycan/LPS O-acetylase OafA/YrhL